MITIGEISKGIEKLPGSRRKYTIREWLSEDLLLRFEGRILTIDVAVILAWGSLAAEAESQVRTAPAMDSLISALALHHDLLLAARNEDDFKLTGVRILNPWKQVQHPLDTRPNGWVASGATIFFSTLGARIWD